MALVDDLRKYRQGKNWLQSNMNFLRESYRGRYVAILGNRVVDSDEDKYDLLKRLWSRGLYPGPVIIQLVD